MKAPYTIFGKTKNVPVVVWQGNKPTELTEWDEELWVERGEDWYALMSRELVHKRVRIIERSAWLASKEIQQ
jgi:hypothetical protein